MWYDDQVWSNYFNLSSPEQAAIIYHKLSTDGADEKVRVARTAFKMRYSQLVEEIVETLQTNWINYQSAMN